MYLSKNDSATGVTNVDYQQFHNGASETTEYLYDQNGNMTEDKNSGITRVGYDANNQPDSVTFSTGESIRYYYDGMGNRLGTDEYTAFMPVYLQGAANTLTDDDDREVLRRRYCGNFVYEDGILQRVLVEGGFITFSNGTPQYHFYIKDHLGSNRVVTDADGNIEEYNHYYPYGALMNISSASTQPYKYNGKELNRLNRLLWYDYSARQYNPILGRFSSVDPLCEKYYGMSPYVYCKCNPINRIDPDGMDDYFDNNGNFIRSTNSGRIIMVLDGEGYVRLSDKCYNSENGQNVLLGIAHYYLSQIDKEPFSLKLDVNEEGASMAYSPQHDSYSIMMDKVGNVSANHKT